MLKIPGLTPLEQFRLRVADKPEIIEQEIAPGLICFAVMKGIGNSDTYNDAWSREARGITFNSLDVNRPGQIASRPFHKFFNLNEREETLAYKLNWSKVTRVMDKRDGSMIHPVLNPANLRSELLFKSKKVVDSEVAVAATNFVKQRPNYIEFCRLMLESGITPIFEWTSPNNRIVIGYQEPELKLLHARMNVPGIYLRLDDLKRRSGFYNIPMVDEVTEFSSFEQLMEAAKTRENTEGWVIQFEDGEMVKVKTEWYMKRHRAMTFYRERDIVELLIDEQLDDVKAMLVGDGIDVAAITNIEARFAADMREIIESVDDVYQAVREKTAKDAAAELKGHKLFGLVMSRHNGKQPNYIQHFQKNYFKQNYSLDTLGMITKVKGEENEEG